jgi:hypothetical protein
MKVGGRSGFTTLDLLSRLGEEVKSSASKGYLPSRMMNCTRRFLVRFPAVTFGASGRS